LRTIGATIPGIDQLELPGVLKDIAAAKDGLVLVTGATGSGKSTTLAAMIDHINATQACHIMTLEDPIEFVHENKLGLVNQRRWPWTRPPLPPRSSTCSGRIPT